MKDIQRGFTERIKLGNKPDISSLLTPKTRLEREGGNGELGQWARLGCG